MEPLPHLIPASFDWRSITPSAASPRLGEAVVTALDTEPPYALLGIPADTGIATRPGARFGPDAIRQQLAKLGTWSGTEGLNVATPLIADLGNLSVLSQAPWKTHQRVEEALESALAAAPWAFPLAIGGDHSLTAPLFRAFQRTRGYQCGLIVFDAHYDVREYDTDNLSSGTPFRRILELGPNALSGRNLVYIGIRPFCNAPAYHHYVIEQGATVIDMAALRERGIARVMEQALNVAGEGTEAVYCSLDIDVIDQGDAPGASATGPGGMRSGDLLEAMRLLGQSGQCAMLDCMEISPPCDHQDMTSRLAAHALAAYIAAREERRTHG
ncbi:MAG: agmatinase family protein [bacterium]